MQIKTKIHKIIRPQNSKNLKIHKLYPNYKMFYKYKLENKMNYFQRLSIKTNITSAALLFGLSNVKT